MEQLTKIVEILAALLSDRGDVTVVAVILVLSAAALSAMWIHRAGQRDKKDHSAELIDILTDYKSLNNQTKVLLFQCGRTITLARVHLKAGEIDHAQQILDVANEKYNPKVG